MRWLLIKDLQILRRSPLLIALLVLYPIVVALLIGFSFSRGPDRPKVAIVNQLRPDEKLQIGNRSVDVLSAQSEVFKRVDAVPVGSREEAIKKVKDGEVLGALIVPEDLVRKLQTGFLAERPVVEVFVNEEDPLKKRLVEDTITSMIAEANQRVSRQFTKTAVSYLDLLLNGGTLNLIGQKFDVLGLEKVERIANRARAEVPAGSPVRKDLEQVVNFVELGKQGLDLTDDVFASVGEPIRVQKTVTSGETVPLTTFAAAVAVALSLMFLATLLAAGSLALERSENAFDRLLRSSLTPTGLVVEKIVLAAVCSFVVTLLMLLGLGLFIPLEWGRFGLWLIGLTFAATAFAAMGTAIGGLGREVTVASLLAFALLLPVAFVSLVPSGVVSAALYDFTRFVAALFPFKATVKLMGSALYKEGEFAGPLLHLAALTVAYGLAARLALKRFS
jgi:ABC-type transport system involved in multi-copper enzyme maturation permease subunit